MIGSRLGSYEILEEIGRGGMGCVYKARQPSLDRIVAVKVLLPQLAADKVFVERFLREARSIATLEHPGIVTIFDVGEASGTYYFAMQLLDGRPLDELLEEGKPLPVETAVDVLEQVARALDFAHRADILHRDVKPGNIILTRSGHAVLTDFGIAQALSDTRLTKTGTSIGSPEYMAPEQIEGKKLDARADLYSLGVVFYQMLTGRVPYQGDSPVAIVYQHVKAPVPSPREADPEIPELCDRVATTLMAKLPEERYPSAEALLSALADEPFAGGDGRTRPGALGSWLAGGAIALGLVLAGVYWLGGMPELGRRLAASAPAEIEAAPVPPAGSIAPAAAEPVVDATPAAEPEPPPAPPTRALRITSEPPGATVVLDGQTLERPTPAEIELLPETEYQLQLRLAGHDGAGWTFSLADLDDRQRSSGVLHFPLTPSVPPGIVSVAAPYPVEVRVAGRTYSSDRIELPAGTYEAQISAPSVFFSESRRLSVASGEVLELALPMATTVTIAANPSRCRVKIDGRDAGYLPAEVSVSLGTHVFEFDWESLGQSLTLTREISATTDRIFATPPEGP